MVIKKNKKKRKEKLSNVRLNASNETSNTNTVEPEQIRNSLITHLNNHATNNNHIFKKTEHQLKKFNLKGNEACCVVHVRSAN